MDMQAKNTDGTWGEILPYTRQGLSALLEDDNIKHVEVFNTTEEQVKKRGPRYT